MLILNNNQPQLLDEKSVKHRPWVHPSNLYANERYFVPLWKVMEANRHENSTILSLISPVVDLHEESGPVSQQIITNSITLSSPASVHLSSGILWVVAVVEWLTWLFLYVTTI